MSCALYTYSKCASIFHPHISSSPTEDCAEGDGLEEAIKRKPWGDEVVFSRQIMDVGGDGMLLVGEEYGGNGGDIELSCTDLIDTAKQISVYLSSYARTHG